MALPIRDGSTGQPGYGPLTPTLEPRSDETEIPGAGRVAWRAGTAGSVLVMLVGATVLAGWATGIAALTSLAPGLVSMKANTALSFVLLGVAVWTLRRNSRRRTIARRILALAAALIGLLTLGEYVFAVDLGIDQLLVDDVHAAPGTSHPGRMAPTTALAITLLGTSLASRSTVRESRFRRTELLVVVAAAIAFLAFTGYLYDASALLGVGSFTQMALHTSLTLLVLCASIIAITPQRSIGAILLSASPGGIVARRLIPAAFLVPITVGWLRLAGERAGLYDTAFGLSIVVVSHIVIFTAVTAWVTWSLDREYRRRLGVEHTASTDVLTGLANRRAIMHRIERLVADAASGGPAFSVIALDANGLKAVNDHAGHAAGDAALIRLGDVLAATLRDGDVAARLGGDEFLALLPATGPRDALAVARRVREALEQDVRAGGLGAGLGVATWAPGLDGDSLIAAADAALYEDKRARGTSARGAGTPPAVPVG